MKFFKFEGWYRYLLPERLAIETPKMVRWLWWIF